MLFPNHNTWMRTMEERTREALRACEGRRAARQTHRDRQSRLSRLAAQLLSSLGRLLVALGQHLEQYGAQSAVSPGEPGEASASG